MTKYIVITQNDEFEHYEHRSRRKSSTRTFSSEPALMRHVAANRNKISDMTIHVVEGSLDPKTLVAAFDNKRLMALSKLTAEEKVLMGIS